MRLSIIAPGLMACLCSPVLADSILAENPFAIVAKMQEFGYRAEMSTDSTGDPLINSAADGSNFSIYFYGCTAGANCSAIQFSAGFDLTNGTSANSMNDWNTRKRYGKAYIDDNGDPTIEMDFNLAEGGISEENFRDSLGIWERLLGDFKDHISW